MTETLTCTRCGKTVAALERAPLPGPAGAEILAKTCPPCWEEWKEQEVRVINELRLNFMDPKSPEILERHMREFLVLGEAGPAGEGTGG